VAGWTIVSTESFTLSDVEGPRPRLHQPWRFAVAAPELVLAVVAVLFAVTFWRHGVTTMVTPLGAGHPPLVSTIYLGNWMAGAIGLVTVAALLVLDAIREALLAIPSRTRKQPPVQTASLPPGML
jgi:hypothetical protein